MPDIIVNPVNMAATRVEILADEKVVGMLIHDADQQAWLADEDLHDATGLVGVISPFIDELTDYLDDALAA